jgi:hypothetical protein
MPLTVAAFVDFIATDAQNWAGIVMSGGARIE